MGTTGEELHLKTAAEQGDAETREATQVVRCESSDSAADPLSTASARRW